MTRRLYVVLGDQLDPGNLSDLDPAKDAVWMAELEGEATHVRCHKQRILYFFTAMRHFRDALLERGVPVAYRELPDAPAPGEPKSHEAALELDLPGLRPETVVLYQPGDLRVLTGIEAAVKQAHIPLELREDPHFLVSVEDFQKWARGKKKLVLEHFYRWMRKREGILLEPDGNPAGGAWNFDSDNRESFGKAGPPPIRPRPGHIWDDTTKAVAALVERRFADHPGTMERFDLPVTPAEAERLAEFFLDAFLPHFGRYQDAMWGGDPVLWHSRLSAPMNLKLISPRRLVEGAVARYQAGAAPIGSVEGFVRQILGWREFIRGIYWLNMPEYAGKNELGCEDRDVPGFFWDGQTDMACVADSMRGLVELGYVHHIHRLMVLGLFSLQLGVHPHRFHEWHMAMYLDAVDWVSLPNALGMSQYGDGGVVGTKPYAATGKYIQRMSNYCGGCRYRPAEASGERACPFTTLYWDFLDRHRARFEKNPRMALQIKNVARKSDADLESIRGRAKDIRARIDAGERI